MEKENASEQKVVLTRVDEPNFKYILPSPINRGSISVEEALWRRRSHRLFLTVADEDIIIITFNYAWHMRLIYFMIKIKSK